MVSTKTMTTDYQKNIPNRFEEAIGDGTNLKMRFPLGSLGYVMVTPANVFDDGNAYAKLVNLVDSLETAEGRYDAAALVVFELDDGRVRLLDESDSRTPGSAHLFGRFFKRILEQMFRTTPVEFLSEQRRRWGYTVPGAPLRPPVLAEG